MDRVKGRCIHLMEYECCAICSGLMEKKEKQQLEYSDVRVRRSEARARRLYMQESSKFFATKHAEPYTDEELKYIIVNTKDTTRQDTEIFYNIAKEVKRRLGSIEWLWNYIWREGFNNVLKAGYDNKLYERVQQLKKGLV